MAEQLKYIAIEGLIGAGKTVLARMIAERVKGRLVLEEVEENPYLGKFYQDIRSYAFQTQLFFLFSRYKQQQELRQESLFEAMTISDYMFDKDRIFAYLNLNELEIGLYEKVYGILVKELHKPDLVVYLQAGLDTIRERIRKRSRACEAEITTEYLEALGDAYNKFFVHYEASPLLIVNADNLDFVKNPADFDNLFREIMAGTRGRRYYSTAQTRDGLWHRKK